MEHVDFKNRFYDYKLSEEEAALYESIQSISMRKTSGHSVKLCFKIDRDGKTGDLTIYKHTFFSSPARFSKLYKDITGEHIPKELRNINSVAWDEFSQTAYIFGNMGMIT